MVVCNQKMNRPDHIEVPMRKKARKFHVIAFVCAFAASNVILSTPVFAGGAAESSPPVLEIPPQQRQFISPANQDGVQDVLTLPFSEVVVPAPDMVIVEYALAIFDSDGNPVFEQRERQTERRGFFGNIFGGEKPRVEIPESLSWDGRDSAGEFVADGEYTYQLAVVDDARNVALSPPFAVTVDNTPPQIREFPPLEYRVFAPNGDGIRDTITVGMSGSRELRWIIEVVNQQDHVVFQALFENERPRDISNDPAPPSQFVWDGTEGAPGQPDRPIAPEGRYRVVLTGTDRAGNTTREEHPETITLSLQQPSLSLGVADDNNAFSPTGPSARTTVTLEATVSEPELVEQWEIQIISGGQVVRSESRRGAPPREWVFDGRRQDGSVLADGTVQARLRARLINGITVNSPMQPLIIDTVPPEASVAFATAPVATEAGQPLVFGGENKRILQGSVRFEEAVAWQYRVTRDGETLRQGLLRELQEELGLEMQAVPGRDALVQSTFTIDSFNATPEELPDGLYELTITGMDRAGNRGNSRPARFIADRRTPAVTLSVDRFILSPVSASPQGEVEFRMSVEADDRVEQFRFEIRNDQDRVVRSEYRRAPFRTFPWNGLTNGGTIVADGEYTAHLQVVWQNGHTATTEILGPIIADRTPPQIETLAANVRQFSPEESGDAGRVRITQRVVPGDSWVGRIVDTDGTVVVEQEYEDTVTDFLWDGRDEVGTTVPEGDYRYLLIGEDAAGNRTEQSLLVTVSTAPFVSNVRLSVSPERFSPDDDGIDDEVHISIDVNSRNPIQDWELHILDPQNRPFRRFTGTGAPPARITWDGISERGDLVQSAMDYPVRMVLRDTTGATTEGSSTISTDILVMREGDRLRIRISSINFAGNTADLFLSNEVQLRHNIATLQRLAQILQRYENDAIIVEGHAAHVHLDAPRMEREQREVLLPLSRARADEVRKALMILGIDPNRMRTEGFGGSRPVVPHQRTEERWQNRRVEFLLERSR